MSTIESTISGLGTSHYLQLILKADLIKDHAYIVHSWFATVVDGNELGPV